MRVFTVIGPPHSGKTTLVDAIAAREGRATKFTISQSVTLSQFDYLEEPWCAIDIAGGSDHFAFAGPALAASDAAVLCVPPDPDAAVLSAPYLRLIDEAGIPCFLFINRMDASAGRVRDIISALQAYSGHGIVLRQVPIRDGSDVVGAVDLISERAWQYREGSPSDLIEIPDQAMDRETQARTELLESLADFDDTLLEQLIEDKRPAQGEIFDIASKVAQTHVLVPAFLGAASHGNGINRLMKSLRHEAPDVTATRDRVTQHSDTRAIGVLADVRKHVGKLVVLRAFGPGVAGGAPLGGGTVGSITQLDTKTAIDELPPGSVGLAVKSDHLNAGQIYTAKGSEPLPDWAACRPPGFRHIVAPVHDRDETRLSSALTRLAEIDPGLQVSQDEQTGKPMLSVQGPLHARYMIEKLAEDFGVEIEEEAVPPSFRETIKRKVNCRHRHRKQSGGAGQFADVEIEIKPQPRGAGFNFEEVVKGGAVPRNYIPSVAAGAEEALLSGPHGFRVVDVSVILKDGKHHSVDSSDHAFRTAGKNAVIEAMADAGSIVLQPIERVDIQVPTVFSGGLVPTISSLKGQVLGFETNPDADGWDVFSALLPASSRDELFRSLGSTTKGTAWAVSTFDHYEELHDHRASSGKVAV